MSAPKQQQQEQQPLRHHHTTSASIRSQGSGEDRPIPSALWTEDFDADRTKDTTTGRFLSKKARTCLRCLSHGLRCTLEFSGMETDTRCNACQRAGADGCVRPALADIDAKQTLSEQRRLFEAVPVTVTRKGVPPAAAAAAAAAAAGGAPSSTRTTYKFEADQAGTAKWPDVVEKHHAERRLVYVNGMPIDPRDVKVLALPSFRDAALAHADADADADTGADDEDGGVDADADADVDEDQDEDEDAAAAADPHPHPPVLNAAPWRTATWKDYLPVPENRSLVGEVEELFSEVRWQGDGGDGGEEGEGEGKGKGEEVIFDDDRTKFLQRIRRYPPRDMHLNEMLGETY